MATKTETRVETREATKVVARTCDLCGREAVAPNARAPFVSANPNQIDEVSVRRTRGDSYLDGCDDVTTEEYDVCPDCWDNRIKPLFAVEPRKTESDW